MKFGMKRGKTMKARPGDFRLMAILAVAALTAPAFGQTAAPTAAPAANSTRNSAASIPDFSGIWAHPYLTGFEPPASGPGPVRNKSRLPNGTGRFQQLVGDYTNPILKPEAARIVKEHGDISLSGEGYPTPSNQCWPGGVPYIFWDFLIQMFQEPDRITMTYRQGNEVRHVRMNQPHPAQVAPSWYGDAVGHYEGDTLVIDTIGFNTRTEIDGFRTPHTGKLHVIERWRLVEGGNMLEGIFRIDDPDTFNEPWSGMQRLRRVERPMHEEHCAENNTPLFDYHMPVANKPDF